MAAALIYHFNKGSNVDIYTVEHNLKTNYVKLLPMFEVIDCISHFIIFDIAVDLYRWDCICIVRY